MKRYNEEQTCIWLAALIDGEGSIMLNKRTYSERRTAIQPGLTKKPHYRASVTIATADYRLMAALIKKTNIARVYQHRVGGDPRTPRKREQWTWRLANDDIRQWLPLIKPHLILKQEQAGLLLEALIIKTKITPGNPGFLPAVRGSFIVRLNAIYLKIRELNQRGRVILEETNVAA